MECLNNRQVVDESNDLVVESFVVLVHRLVVVLLMYLVEAVLDQFVVDLEQNQLVLRLLMNYLVILLVFLMELVHRLVVSVMLLVVLVHLYDIDMVAEMDDVADIDQVVVHDDHQVDILHMVVDSSYNHEMDDHHNDLVVVHPHELSQIDLVLLLHLETDSSHF